MSADFDRPGGFEHHKVKQAASSPRTSGGQQGKETEQSAPSP